MNSKNITRSAIASGIAAALIGGYAGFGTTHSTLAEAANAAVPAVATRQEPNEPSLAHHGHAVHVLVAHQRRDLGEWLFRCHTEHLARHHIADGLGAVQFKFLGQIANGQVERLTDHPAAIRSLDATEDAQQCRLADTVGPNHADAITGVELYRHGIEDDLAAMRAGESAALKHGRTLIKPRRRIEVVSDLEHQGDRMRFACIRGPIGRP